MNTFIEEITNNYRVADLMKNNYGNYVVQKALKLATGSHKVILIQSIMKNIDKVGDRKLILKWRTIVDAHLNIENNQQEPIPMISSPIIYPNQLLNSFSFQQENNSPFLNSNTPKISRKEIRSNTTGALNSYKTQGNYERFLPNYNMFQDTQNLFNNNNVETYSNGNNPRNFGFYPQNFNYKNFNFGNLQGMNNNAMSMGNNYYQANNNFTSMKRKNNK